jgi:hypothetical protein
VISGPYTKESVKNDKMSFPSRLASDEITTHGYRALTFTKCTTIMIAQLTVTGSLESSLDKKLNITSTSLGSLSQQL